jgi:GNAT superfamily N-acetyltransferase
MQRPNFHIALRTSVRPSDVQAVREIATSTGFFTEEEIAVAVELLEDRLVNGERSDYRFILADVSDRTVGFASYGPIPCTAASFDLYWIVVHEAQRGQGIGRRLLEETERLIAAEGGRRIYVETSSREQYEPTRQFYLRCGYRIEATLEEFYGPGDSKMILVKAL